MITVLGAGSWGTALAMALARAEHRVWLWGRNSGALAAMEKQRCNASYLPDSLFPEGLHCQPDLMQAIQQAEIIFLAVPSAACGQLFDDMAPFYRQQPVVVATKGIEPRSQLWMHQVLATKLPQLAKLAVLSGPSFAKEVADNLPTAVTVASSNVVLAKEVCGLFSHQSFRAYACDDVMGVEVGGSVKNIMAIATGISDGLGFGANARSALITRGLNEIMCLARALGAREKTLMGLSGMGDLVLTCTDDQSRNRRFGLALAKGFSREEAVKHVGQVVEGIVATEQVYYLAKKQAVPMPITEQVYHILYSNMPVKQAVNNLLSRALTQES
jgi:glycerol-3-phosphate dehydrogenase (NAD(P)+)